MSAAMWRDMRDWHPWQKDAGGAARGGTGRQPAMTRYPGEAGGSTSDSIEESSGGRLDKADGGNGC